MIRCWNCVVKLAYGSEVDKSQQIVHYQTILVNLRH